MFRTKGFVLLITLVTVAGLLGACQPVRPQGSGVTNGKDRAMSPAETMAALIAAQNAGDVDKVMSFYNDDAVLAFNFGGEPNKVEGKEALRAFVEDIVYNWNWRWQYEVVKVESDTITLKSSFWDTGLQRLGVMPWVCDQVVVFKDGKVSTDTWVEPPEMEQQVVQAVDIDNTITGFLAALQAGDADTVLALLADDAVWQPLDLPEARTLAGKEEIGAWLATWFAGHPDYLDQKVSIAGDVVTVAARIGTDDLRSLGVSPVYATDVYTIAGGKVTGVISTAADESRAAYEEARSAAAP